MPPSTYTVLVGVEEHEQRLQHDLDCVDIFGVLGQTGNEPAEGARGHGGRVLFGEAAEPQDGSTTVFEEGGTGEAAAEGADGVGGRLFGRGLGLEHSQHRGGADADAAVTNSWR